MQPIPDLGRCHFELYDFHLKGDGFHKHEGGDDYNLPEEIGLRSLRARRTPLHLCYRTLPVVRNTENVCSYYHQF